ncbi:MAG: hypothetical protein N3B13_08845, partial [Deltaproteobacteria bacterium]|nr:hypothetical protein [Deltaproteobacteria bacterium]
AGRSVVLTVAAANAGSVRQISYVIVVVYVSVCMRVAMASAVILMRSVIRGRVVCLIVQERSADQTGVVETADPV